MSRKENGLIKVITVIRRCGKSYLLDSIFIKLELDKDENMYYMADYY